MSKLVVVVALILLSVCVVAGQDGTAAKSDGKPQQTKKSSAAYSQASAAKLQFMRESGYRNGRPGYIVVYRKPLACGGTDDISNLEWLTVAEAKTRAQTERKGCK